MDRIVDDREATAGEGWLVEQDGPVRWLNMNRPAKLNAMTAAMGTELGELLEAAATDDSVQVLVVSGTGDSFSAGLDRDEMAAGLKNESTFPVEAFYAFAKPTIACVNGLAFGGGATLAVACDLRVMADTATYTFALAKVGITPEWGSSYFLWRLVGWSRALDLFLTGRRVDAAEAERIGLADRVVPRSTARAVTQELAEQIASLPEGTAAATKAVLRRGLDVGFAEARVIERQGLADRVRAMRDRRRIAKATRQPDAT